MDDKLRIESRLAQIGSQEDPATGAVNYPIYQSTAFRHPGLDRARALTTFVPKPYTLCAGAGGSRTGIR